MTATASTFPSSSTADKLALASIGQGDTTATPLQMAMVAQAIANDGKLMRPTLVDRVRASDLTVLSETKSQVMAEAFNKDTADKLTTMMESVVTKPTRRLPSMAYLWPQKPVLHKSAPITAASTAGLSASRRQTIRRLPSQCWCITQICTVRSPQARLCAR